MPFVAIVAVICALAVPVRADRWTPTDSVIEVGVGLVLAGDMLQTRNICADMEAGTAPDWVHETNPIIGRSCERIRPEIYFPLVLVAHVVIVRFLPQPFRGVLQGATIAVQINAIDRNLSAGYGFSW